MTFLRKSDHRFAVLIGTLITSLFSWTWYMDGLFTALTLAGLLTIFGIIMGGAMAWVFNGES